MEDAFLKVLGWAGAVGLIGQAMNGIVRTYIERYDRPKSLIYRFTDESNGSNGHGAEAGRERANL